MKEPLDETERHIILYAKDWYKKNNVIEDLRVLISKTRGCNKVYNEDIWRILIECFRFLSHYQQNNYLFRLFRPFGYLKFQESISFEQSIDSLLGLLGTIAVKDNPDMENLGKPDYNLLPERT